MIEVVGKISVWDKFETDDAREAVKMFMDKHWGNRPDALGVVGESVDLTVFGVCKLCERGILDGDEYRTQYDGEDDEMFCMGCWEKRQVELAKIKRSAGGES